MRHNDPRARADAAMEVACQALSDELKKWERLADLNGETILNIDCRTIGNPFRSSEQWRSLFAELKTTLHVLSNQYAWLEDLVQREIDLKKGKNNEDA